MLAFYCVQGVDAVLGGSAKKHRHGPALQEHGGRFLAKVLFLLPLSPLHNYTGYQRLLVNYCSTYIVQDLVISPLHILTYLSLTSLG